MMKLIAFVAMLALTVGPLFAAGGVWKDYKKDKEDRGSSLFLLVFYLGCSVAAGYVLLMGLAFNLGRA